MTLMYHNPCGDCTSFFVGQTQRRMETRIHGHHLAVKRADTGSQDFENTSKAGHTFDFDNTEIIDQAWSKSSRIFREAWHSDEGAANRYTERHPTYWALGHRITTTPGEVIRPELQAPLIPDVLPNQDQRAARSIVRQQNQVETEW